MSKIKIAIFVHGLSGGVGQVLINYFKNMPDDYDKDIITMHIESDQLLSEFKNYNFNVIKVPSKSESLVKNMYSMYSILKRKKYDIAYAHMTLTNFFPLVVAKYCGIKVRVSYSHLAEQRNIYTNFLAWLTRAVSTNYIACGKEAGKFLYGNKPFRTFNNAVDVSHYAFNNKVRKKIRESLGIKDSTVIIGNVGRFSKQKNHTFLLDLFKKYHDLNHDSVLMLVGAGELGVSLEEKAHNLALDDSVKFLGQLEDVSGVLQAMDLFVQPSLFEGLSLAAIEAQASGVPCVFSSSVTSETKITSDVSFISLSSPLEKWVATCDKMAKLGHSDTSKVLKEKGYDIFRESAKLDIFLKSNLRK